MLVVDDHTTDPVSASILTRLAPSVSNQMLKHVTSPSRGLAAARNAGIAVAQSDLVRFVDADDLLVWGSTDRLADAVSGPGDVAIGSTRCVDMASGMARDLLRPPLRFSTYTSRELVRTWERAVSIPIHSALFRRGLLPDREWFPESLPSKEDFVFWSRILCQDPSIRIIESLVAVYRVRPDSLSRSSPGGNGLAFLSAVSDILRRDEESMTQADIQELWTYFCEVYGVHLSATEWKAAYGLAEEIVGATRNSPHPGDLLGREADTWGGGAADGLTLSANFI